MLNVETSRYTFYLVDILVQISDISDILDILDILWQLAQNGYFRYFVATCGETKC